MTLLAATRRANLPGLIWTLVRTDFKARYHGTFGGYLWALAKPLSMFVVLFAVFSLIFTMDRNYALNLIIGLFFWDFFSEATKSSLACLHAKGFLLTRARFARWVLVPTSSANALITLLLFLVVVCSYIAAFRHTLTLVAVLLVLLYVVLFLLVVLGFGLAASVLFLRYRDLNQVWDLVLQAGFFVAPVIYPLNIVPERYHFFLYIWLPTAVIQFTRSVLVTGVVPTLRAHLMLVASAILVLVIGALVFRRLGPRAVEEL
jgi:lipopolysaccharide transport system permease protein